MTTNDVSAADTQLELTFNAPTAPAPAPATGSGRPRPGVPPRSRRNIAARWWFARMRDVVRDARIWTAEAQAAMVAAQVDLPLAFPTTRLKRTSLALATQTTAFPGQIAAFPSRPAAAA